ncbi:hypothetical protein PRZ48_013945 [Zasmidium cellare]|uniref:Cytokinin riboside 5'-monophosphate phosphoribohydrolase n=1 Tax=Zasmidium cellare TaxID=395010 RepID=A0ABR0DZK4_ZASCE|nr:hypothetical protein PRZ48_013945 [Zasmidium cellare]
MSPSLVNGTEKKKGPVVCVFCGSAPGNSPAHVEQAQRLAQLFHKHNITLIFGGGTTGVMGALAAELVRLSGPNAVHGVIPEALVRFERDETDQKPSETVDPSFGRTTRVPDMHTRKQMMVQEITTWNQLGIHDKPVVLFNVEGYWDGLLTWIKKATEAGFVREGNADILVEAHSAEDVVKRLRDYETAGGRLELDWEQK